MQLETNEDPVRINLELVEVSTDAVGFSLAISFEAALGEVV